MLIHGENTITFFWIVLHHSGLLFICATVMQLKKDLFKGKRIPEEKIKVIHNGIDLDKFSNVSSSFQKRLIQMVK